MLQAVLFDLDGTLLDRDRSLASFLDAQYDRYPAFHGMDKQAFVQRFVELDQKGYVWKDRVYRTLIEEGRFEADWEELLADYEASFQRHCIGFPGLIGMLDELKRRNLKLGMITNGFGGFQMGNIRGLAIEHYFDAILVSEIEGLRKPDRRIFELALQRLGVEAGEAIFVGDHPVNDVEACMLAGMRGVWKEDEALGRPGEGAFTIKELPELLALVAEWTTLPKTS